MQVDVHPRFCLVFGIVGRLSTKSCILPWQPSIESWIFLEATDSENPTMAPLILVTNPGVDPKYH